MSPAANYRPPSFELNHHCLIDTWIYFFSEERLPYEEGSTRPDTKIGGELIGEVRLAVIQASEWAPSDPPEWGDFNFIFDTEGTEFVFNLSLLLPLVRLFTNILFPSWSPSLQVQVAKSGFTESRQHCLAVVLARIFIIKPVQSWSSLSDTQYPCKPSVSNVVTSHISPFSVARSITHCLSPHHVKWGLNRVSVGTSMMKVRTFVEVITQAAPGLI